MGASRPYATSAIVTSLVFAIIGGGIAALGAANGSVVIAFVAGLATWAVTVYVMFDKIDEMVIDRIKEYDRFSQMQEAGIE